MPYRYLSDLSPADAAFEATGTTLEDLFRAAWDATLNLMIERLEEIRPTETRIIELRNASREMLLFEFLGELLFWKDAENLFLRLEALTVAGDDRAGYSVRARGAGERIDPKRHDLGIDVKAVTLDQFHLYPVAGGWAAQVIVDT